MTDHGKHVRLDVIGALERLTRGLESEGYVYAVGGAVALSYWAVPRATLDIDVGVDVDTLRLPDLAAALKRIGCELDEQSVLQAGERGDFGARLGGIRIDVFLPVHALAQAALERRLQVPFGDSLLWIQSAEDLVLLKLLFGRTKDYADLERLFAAHGDTMDHGYLERWVADLFGADDERALRFRQLAARSAV